MLIDAETLAHGAVMESDITIVGAGAAGIVMALELSRAGRRVNLIESGGPRYDPRAQALADTPHFDPALHPPMHECTRRQIGGTSVIWGGRVVPFDPVDFDERPHVPHSRWPITYESIRPYFPKVCAYLRCGEPEFDIRRIPGVTRHSIVPGLPDENVTTTSLERWSVMNFGTVYAGDLRREPRLTLVHGLTCVEIECEPDAAHVSAVRAKTLSGKEVRLRAGRFVLACGGLSTTRLLLASDRAHPGGIGNHSGLLGRFYQGHISGRIAEVRFSTPPRETVYGFDRDPEGVYLRRRFTFTREFQHEAKLGNISAWLVNPDIGDPRHGNGILSFAYLALSSPLGRFLASEAIRKSAIKSAAYGGIGAHLLNMLRDLPRTAVFIPTFGYKRYFARRRVPGFFQPSRSNVYALHYFGEPMPNPDSRVVLADERDELGMRRIRIEQKYSKRDVEYVIDAHRHWDAYLRRHGRGELRYIVDDIEKSIWEQAGDGFHQVGTTRMAERPEDGVVDPSGRVHGLDNLYVTGSSTFVTAGQANSMFMILVLALRLAEHLRNLPPRA